MSSSSAETYKYNRIDLASDAIRLVYLTRGYYSDPIECHLFETWLHEIEGVPYEALSYHWNGSTKGAEITLDGCKAKITDNLYKALQHLRLEDRDRILWVDAICIDQEDEKERGHQVGQMRSVYKSAEQVIVWLGTSTDDIILLMDKMNEMHEDLLSSFDEKTSLATWKNFWCASDLSHRYRAALEDIFRRRWFRRIWIIQEVASARAAVVVCGRRSVPAKTFARVPSMLKVEPEKHIQAVLDIMPGPRRKESWWGGKRDLHTLMVKFAASEATDQRDKIYALLGISSDACDNKAFPPDYEKPFTELLRDTAQFLILGTMSGDHEYRVPAVTLTELIQDIGRVRREAAQWAMENLETPAFEQFLKSIELSHGDVAFLWRLTEGSSSPRVIEAARKLLQLYGSSNLTSVDQLIAGEQLSLLSDFLDSRKDFLDESKISLLIGVAIAQQKPESVRLLLARLEGPVDGSILKAAGASVDEHMKRLVLDDYYGKLRSGSSGPPVHKEEYSAMYQLLQAHHPVEAPVGVNATRFVQAVRQGYTRIPKLLLPYYDASTMKSLISEALDQKDDETVMFLLSHTRHTVDKLVLLRAIENARFDVFRDLLARRSSLNLADLSDLLCALAEYCRVGMVRPLLECVHGTRLRALIWDIALTNAFNADNTGLVGKLNVLKRENEKKYAQPDNDGGSEQSKKVDSWND